VPATPTDDGPDSVLAKAFAVLGAVAAASGPVGPAELSRATGLPKSTAFRLARELTALGALRGGRDGYRIGLRLFELGNRHYPADLRQALQPYLADLCRATGLIVQAGVLDGTDVVYLERYVPRGRGTIRATKQLRIPGNCAAAGKVLLAAAPARRLDAMLGPELPALTTESITSADRLREQLRRVRRDGYAGEVGEVEPGMASVAVPVLTPGSRTIRSALELRGPVDELRVDAVLASARVVALAMTRAATVSPPDR
jgi:DNA-binding IclR family transcriptional regulator